MSSRLRLLLASCLLLGCAAPAASVDVAPIVDGSPAPDEDAIVSIVGMGFCSGTLIAPRLVLTAKHCVVAEGAPGPIEADSIRVGIGPEWFVTTASYDVEAILTTPGPLLISSPPNPVTTATGTDIALLVLTEPVVGVRPIPVHRGNPEVLTGTVATAIGYGRTRTDGGGEKNQVTTTITTVTSVLVEAVTTICQGDSGGPLLLGTGDAREVVGVASFGVFSALVGGEAPCPAERDYWNRVDVQMELIDRALVRSGACVANTDETCNSLDDDCDGAVDETCAALGEACATDADCALAPLPEPFASDYAGRATSCVSIDGASVCALSCDALAPRTSCLAIEQPFRPDELALDGWVCGRADGCAGLCVRDTGERLAEGAACGSDGECASARCAGGACRTACAGDLGICPVGEVCLADADACGVCAAAVERATGRGRGEPCSAPSECTSGLCTDGLCTLACVMNTQCGADFRCAFDHCVPGAQGAVGEACTLDVDCSGSSSCVARGGMDDPDARVCARACGAGARCTTGAECVMIDESSYCLPEAAVPGEACASTSDCVGGECVDATCVVPCGAAGAGCPAGLACMRSEDGRGAYCTREAMTMVGVPMPSSGCGCHATGGGEARAPLATLLLVGAGLAVVRRVRRRR